MSRKLWLLLPQWQLGAAGAEGEIYVWHNNTGGRVCSSSPGAASPFKTLLSLIKPRQECLTPSSPPQTHTGTTPHPASFCQVCCLLVWLIISLVIVLLSPKALQNFIPSLLFVRYLDISEGELLTWTNGELWTNGPYRTSNLSMGSFKYSIKQSYIIGPMEISP